MFDKGVGNDPHALEYVPECYKTQNICNIAVDTRPSTTEHVPDRVKTQ